MSPRDIRPTQDEAEFELWLTLAAWWLHSTRLRSRGPIVEGLRSRLKRAFQLSAGSAIDA